MWEMWEGRGKNEGDGIMEIGGVEVLVNVEGCNLCGKVGDVRGMGVVYGGLKGGKL